jgi:hypothetical protein
MNEIEYILIPKEHYWVLRFNKKPKKQKLEQAMQGILHKPDNIRVGISKSIIDKLIVMFQEKLRYNDSFGTNISDFYIMSSKTQLNVLIVKEIFEQKFKVQK